MMPPSVRNVLLRLRMEHPAAVSQNRVRYMLGADRQTTARVLRKLEGMGLVRRCVNDPTKWQAVQPGDGTPRQEWIHQANTI